MYSKFLRNPNSISLGLAVQYKRRRDLLVDLFMKNFDLKLESSGIDPQKASGIKYLAYPKRTRSNSNIEKRERAHIFSLSPPTSGMFVWVNLYFSSGWLKANSYFAVEVQFGGSSSNIRWWWWNTRNAVLDYSCKGGPLDWSRFANCFLTRRRCHDYV